MLADRRGCILGVHCMGHQIESIQLNFTKSKADTVCMGLGDVFASIHHINNQS